MLEVTLKDCEEKDSKKDAIYERDRREGNNMINQTRGKLGQSEKKVSDLRVGQYRYICIYVYTANTYIRRIQEVAYV